MERPIKERLNEARKSNQDMTYQFRLDSIKKGNEFKKIADDCKTHTYNFDAAMKEAIECYQKAITPFTSTDSFDYAPQDQSSFGTAYYLAGIGYLDDDIGMMSRQYCKKGLEMNSNCFVGEYSSTCQYREIFESYGDRYTSLLEYMVKQKKFTKNQATIYLEFKRSELAKDENSVSDEALKEDIACQAALFYVQAIKLCSGGQRQEDQERILKKIIALDNHFSTFGKSLSRDKDILFNLFKNMPHSEGTELLKELLDKNTPWGKVIWKPIFEGDPCRFDTGMPLKIIRKLKKRGENVEQYVDETKKESLSDKAAALVSRLPDASQLLSFLPSFGKTNSNSSQVEDVDNIYKI